MLSKTAEKPLTSKEVDFPILRSFFSLVKEIFLMQLILRFHLQAMAAQQLNITDSICLYLLRAINCFFAHTIEFNVLHVPHQKKSKYCLFYTIFHVCFHLKVRQRSEKEKNCTGNQNSASNWSLFDIFTFFWFSIKTENATNVKIWYISETFRQLLFFKKITSPVNSKLHYQHYSPICFIIFPAAQSKLIVAYHFPSKTITYCIWGFLLFQSDVLGCCASI